jgi:NAD(P)-dependent dehydrogenase (short-subunit alcohol dehydrogenase family)
MSFDLAAGLAGRGVMVTGAGGGIGREVARAFAAAGARVLAVDLRSDAVEAVVAELEGDGHAAAAVDLSDISTHRLLIERARRELGELYVLAHLAAVLRRRSSIDDVTEEDWDIQLDVNLKAAFFLCRASANAMVEQGGGGRVIAFTSQGWQSGGFGGSVAYAASKGGIVSMARGLARTYGPHQITVNTVSPGLVETPMLTDGLSDEVYESLKRQTPLGRVAQPHELAGTVIFLASRHAGYISGATINVSGGFLMY